MVHHKGELQFPDDYTDDATKKFLADYFEISNTPEAHDESAKFFAENGIFAIGSAKAQGRTGKLKAPSSHPFKSLVS